MPWRSAKPVLNASVRSICKRPYPRHPKGCPNWNKKAGCPPQARLFQNEYDVNREIVAVWNVFDLFGHVRRLHEKHPNWTRAQLECCLYWQGTARKQLRAEVQEALKEHPGAVAIMCPEAMGVDVTATMCSVGVDLEWPPVTVTIQVAFLAHRRA